MTTTNEHTHDAALLRARIAAAVTLRLQQPLPDAAAFERAYADVCDTVRNYVVCAAADDSYSMRVPIADNPADYAAWNIWPITLFDVHGCGVGLVACDITERIWGVSEGSKKCAPWPVVRSRLRGLVSMVLACGVMPDEAITVAPQFDPETEGDAALPLPLIDLVATVNIASMMAVDPATAKDAEALAHLSARLKTEGAAVPGAQRVLVVSVSSLTQTRIGFIPLRAADDGVWRTGDPQPLSAADETVSGGLVPNPLAVLDNGQGGRQ